VLGRKNVMTLSAGKNPDVMLITSTPPDKDETARGDKAGSVASDGSTNCTASEERRCGIDPANVMNMLESTDNGIEGFSEMSIDTKLAFFTMEESETAGKFDPSEPAWIAGYVPTASRPIM
jgi:hypothetical protein